MKKHAFLILAHNEFEVLQKLCNALNRNDVDIFIHIDKKVKQIPAIIADKSKVTFIKDRVEVYWGTLNLVLAETILLKEALNSDTDYEYFHIISGIHYPIKPIDEILKYYSGCEGKSIIMEIEDSVDTPFKRLGRYHFFMNYYCNKHSFIKEGGQFLWKLIIKLQEILHISRNITYWGGKASNWCSLTRTAASAWINDTAWIQETFHHTFCSDEYVTMAILKRHNLPYANEPRLLYQEFRNANPRVFTEDDYKLLISSDAFFARKFTADSFSLISKIEHKTNEAIKKN